MKSAGKSRQIEMPNPPGAAAAICAMVLCSATLPDTRLT